MATYGCSAFRRPGSGGISTGPTKEKTIGYDVDFGAKPREINDF